ncbi:MAG TPA: tetratricopeptide repeat protein, partial [Cyclobacteriaceae bacterium]|nr:tetratricopeptide repeat protein [Cyclobacteriaceae bacterium]
TITAKSRSEVSVAGDLTEIKNGEFADNVISETLVEILIRQGKKEKAIEVLKKLIWKFPQKKTYFAAQIEDLKK